jgi:hypothetical protein
MSAKGAEEGGSPEFWTFGTFVKNDVIAVAVTFLAF